jgi:hypothetical protein
MRCRLYFWTQCACAEHVFGSLWAIKWRLAQPNVLGVAGSKPFRRKTFAVSLEASKYLGVSPVVPADTRRVARWRSLCREAPASVAGYVTSTSIHVLEQPAWRFAALVRRRLCVMGARRVPCGGENTSKQPHAGVSIALNSAPVKPEATPGWTLSRSHGVRAVFSSAPPDGEHPFNSIYTTIYERG